MSCNTEFSSFLFDYISIECLKSSDNIISAQGLVRGGLRDHVYDDS